MSFRDYLYFVKMERGFYSELAKNEMLEDPSLTYDGLLSLSESIIPSYSLNTGGLMLELYVLRFGIERHRKAIEDRKVNSLER